MSLSHWTPYGGESQCPELRPATIRHARPPVTFVILMGAVVLIVRACVYVGVFDSAERDVQYRTLIYLSG
jgi:hypothetical protein